MATRKPKENDASLPFVALQLLAPPVRLVSAALWKVMKQRDVMQYGVVEEFVTSACETVPGLLTVRHQGKLALGLRGRLILELCCTQPDEKVIKPHLERIRAPAAMSPSSAAARRDVKIVRTVESFRSLVHALVTDPAEREHFFKEEFPVDYGPKFDQELEKLLWEFLIRLDQLLPVPNLAQTVSWLSDSPPVLEECARAATQPQLLKILLQHQACLGHLETAASLPPNMGDSILDSLSLPPSGRAPSDRPTGAKKSAAYPSGGSQTREETALITPVIGLISNEDVPIMISASKRMLRGDDVTNKHLNPKEASNFSLVGQRQNPKSDGVKADGEQAEEEEEERSAAKRQRPDKSESDEEEVFRMIRPEKKRSNSLRNAASRLRLDRSDRRTNESEEDGTKTARDEVLESCMSRLGVKQLRLPQDPSLCSIFVSCLSNQPRVVLEKVSVASGGANRKERGGKSFYAKRQNQRRKSSDRPQKPDSDFLGPDDKENHPVLPSISSSPPQHRRNAGDLTNHGEQHSEDYVADSEDEATKNFKGRLFTKRYYKTKHGTYVPTLREYWKPGMTRRHLMSAGSKRR